MDGWMDRWMDGCPSVRPSIRNTNYFRWAVKRWQSTYFVQSNFVFTIQNFHRPFVFGLDLNLLPYTERYGCASKKKGADLPACFKGAQRHHSVSTTSENAFCNGLFIKYTALLGLILKR